LSALYTNLPLTTNLILFVLFCVLPVWYDRPTDEHVAVAKTALTTSRG